MPISNVRVISLGTIFFFFNKSTGSNLQQQQKTKYLKKSRLISLDIEMTFGKRNSFQNRITEKAHQTVKIDHVVKQSAL